MRYALCGFQLHFFDFLHALGALADKLDALFASLHFLHEFDAGNGREVHREDLFYADAGSDLAYRHGLGIGCAAHIDNKAFIDLDALLLFTGRGHILDFLVHTDSHAGLDLRGLDIDGQSDEFGHKKSWLGMAQRLAKSRKNVKTLVQPTKNPPELNPIDLGELGAGKNF